MGEEKVELKVVEDVKFEYYTDVMRVSHHPRTFVMDFGRVVPFRDEIKYEMRIFMSPQHFKTVVRALQENLKKYEEGIGYITVKE